MPLNFFSIPTKASFTKLEIPLRLQRLIKTSQTSEVERNSKLSLSWKKLKKFCFSDVDCHTFVCIINIRERESRVISLIYVETLSAFACLRYCHNVLLGNIQIHYGVTSKYLILDPLRDDLYGDHRLQIKFVV